MSVQASMSPDERTVTVRVPLTIRKRGGRKQVLASDGTSGWAPRSARVDSTLVKALARAHRCKRTLEGGTFSTVAELAAAERINPSYLCRVLRLTLLAPEIVEAILNGTQPDEITLNRLMKPFPVEWKEQATSVQASAAPLEGKQVL